MAAAIRPLLMIFYLAGFDLNELKSYKNIQRLYSTILSSLCIGNSCFFTYQASETLIVLRWNINNMNDLRITNYHILNIVVTAVTLYSVSWNGMVDIWIALSQLERLINYDNLFYRTIHRQSWTFKLKYLYQLVCLVASRLHSRLEWIFFSQINYTFVITVTVCFFFIVNDAKTIKASIPFRTWIIDLIVGLWLITYTSDGISKSVQHTF